ncbi:MAG TPA: hypothetical protein VIS48_08350 [Candidatus Kryptonia bacterium]
MTKRETIRAELTSLYEEGANLALAFQKKEDKHFAYAYQRWYTKTLPGVALIAQDRLSEFRSYYEIDPKRKSLGYGTYVIQDYLKGVAPSKAYYFEFDTRDEALKCFLNQLTILNSLTERIDSVLSNVEGELYAELQDGEIVVARQLAKVSMRAAGALMGVLIEGHLQKVAANHAIKVNKKNPSIADFNDQLKAASIIDTSTWRKTSFLADLRNLCVHKKDSEPREEQVEELIQGAEWLTKNVF